MELNPDWVGFETYPQDPQEFLKELGRQFSEKLLKYLNDPRVTITPNLAFNPSAPGLLEATTKKFPANETPIHQVVCAIMGENIRGDGKRFFFPIKYRGPTGEVRATEGVTLIENPDGSYTLLVMESADSLLPTGGFVIVGTAYLATLPSSHVLWKNNPELYIPFAEIPFSQLPLDQRFPIRLAPREDSR